MIDRTSGSRWHPRRRDAIAPHRAGLRWFWLALWIGLCGLWGNAVASEPGLGLLSAPAVQLDSQVAGNLIGRHMHYLEDPAGTLTLAQVLSMPERFALSTQPTPNFSFTRSSYWFHVRMENRDAPEHYWLLETQYPLLDHFTIYALRDGQLSDTTQGGRALAFAQRPLKHRNFVYGFEAAAGQSLDLYIQVRTASSLQLPLALWTQASFLAKDHEEQFAFGIYYGVLAAMLLYNLMIFLSIREISYFHYLYFISAAILFQMTLNGLAYEYFWPSSPQWGAAALPTLIFFALVGILNFSRTFLNLGAHLPRVNRWLRYGAYLLAALGVSAVVGNYAIMIKLATAFSLITVVLVFVCGIISLLRGERQARYFLLAWVALLAGIIAYALKTVDLLPSNMLTEYGLQIGSALEVVLLSFALAHRMTLLKEENERIQMEGRQHLEQRVQQRTQELGVALNNLSSANAALQALNLTDGLTGIKNRKHFDVHLANEVKRASRSNLPLSLLMIDIDHFKQVNDQYGHLAGDACLRAVATTMLGCLLRPGDDVVRYGGEEFAIILPQTDEAGAVNLANKICKTVAALHFEFEGQIIPVTVSIGCHATRPAIDCTAQSLIAAADAALYRAKHNGRNRVCLTPG